MEGTTILHYEIEELLGSGGMGSVYKARDTNLDTYRALKFLHPGLVNIDYAKSHLLREARTQAKLFHPNIAALLELQKTDKHTFLVMEYVDGPSLDTYLNEFKPSLNEKLNLLLQITGALSVAHNHGILHRDIKPGNIMVSSDGTVKVSDFGLAKAIGHTSLTRSGETKGTAPYMAPEAFGGKDLYASADVWSLGILAFEMLEGSPPFIGSTFETVAYQVVNESYPPVSKKVEGELPGISEFLATCLNKDSKKRYADGSETFQALSAIAAQAGVEYSVPIHIPIRQHSRRRNRMITAVVGSFVIAVLILFGKNFYPFRTALHYSESDTSWPATSKETSPCWDSSGKRIAMLTFPDRPAIQIWSNLSTGNQRQETYYLDNEAGYKELQWSPNDSVFAVAGTSGLYLYYPYTIDQQKQVLIDIHSTSNIVWSSDGQWLVYVRDAVNEDDTLYRIGPLESTGAITWGLNPEPINMTGLEDFEDSVHFNDPIYTHKDDQLAFWILEQGQHAGVFSVKAEGGRLRKIMDGSLLPTLLNWDENRSSLLFFSITRKELCSVKIFRNGKVNENRIQNLNVPTMNVSDFNYCNETSNILITTSNTSNSLWRIPFSTNQDSLDRISTVFNHNYTPTTSNDGRYIYYSAHELATGWRLRRYDIEKDEDEDLPVYKSTITTEWFPALSPNDRYLVYVAVSEGTSNLWIFDQLMNRHYRLTNDQFQQLYPTWGSDGETIFYTWQGESDGRQLQEIRMLNLNIGTNQVSRIGESVTIAGTTSCINPLLSEDGSCMLYSRMFNGESTMFVLDLETGVSKMLGKGSYPALSPSRKDVYYFRGPWLYVINNWSNMILQTETTEKPVIKIPANLQLILRRPLAVGKNAAYAAFYEFNVGSILVYRPER